MFKVIQVTTRSCSCKNIQRPRHFNSISPTTNSNTASRSTTSTPASSRPSSPFESLKAATANATTSTQLKQQTPSPAIIRISPTNKKIVSGTATKKTVVQQDQPVQVLKFDSCKIKAIGDKAQAPPRPKYMKSSYFRDENAGFGGL